jgi:hypothetical protein
LNIEITVVKVTIHLVDEECCYPSPTSLTTLDFTL